MSLPGYDTTTGEAFGKLFLADYIDPEVVAKLMDQKLDKIRFAKTGFRQKIKQGKDLDHLKPKYMEQQGYPRRFTATLSGGNTLTVTSDIFNVSPSRVNLLKMVRPNTVLRHSSGGTTYWAEVSAVDGTNPVMTVAATPLGSSLPSNASGLVWDVCGQPYTDKQDADNPRMVTRKSRYTTSQIFSDTFQIGKQRSKQRMEGGIDEIETQIEELLWKLDQEADDSILTMPPVIVDGLPASIFEATDERSRLMGLEWQAGWYFGSGGEWENADFYRDMGGLAPDKPDFDQLAKDMMNNMVNFQEGNWCIFTNSNTRQFLHDADLSFRNMDKNDKEIGFMVDYINLKIGKRVPIYDCLNFPDDKSTIINLDACEWNYFTQDHVTREELPTGGRYRKWQISFSLIGLKIRKPGQSMGWLRNHKVA